MSPCPGLIPCTPPPTPAPTGLTAREIEMLGQVGASAAVVLILAGFILIVALLAFSVWITTR